MAYLLDANVFIEAKRLYYQFSLCPGFWDFLDRAFAEGQLLSLEAIKDELAGMGDDLSEWVEARPDFWADTDAAVLTSLAELTGWVNRQNYYPAAIATFTSSADFYLVGHAAAHRHHVVTREVPSNAVKRVKIPEACVAMGVPYVTPFVMLRRLGARFNLKDDDE